MKAIGVALISIIFLFPLSMAQAADKVYSVDHIQLAIVKTKPPKLVITAIGHVNSSGWTNPRLHEYVYVQFPPDGIWDFDFVADRPTGPVLWVMTPVATSYVFEGSLAHLKGVRVHAATNTLEKRLDTARADVDTIIPPRDPKHDPTDGGDRQVCGGIVGALCPKGMYCNIGSQCNVADAQGICEPKPTACTREFNPVCGCDGKTHSNPCTAAAAGVSIDHKGPCKAAVCGGIAGIRCKNKNEFCNLPPGSCKIADAQGTCQVKPDFCIELFAPVCGCDGKTYGNQCQAHAAGVSVDHLGACGRPSKR